MRYSLALVSRCMWLLIRRSVRCRIRRADFVLTQRSQLGYPAYVCAGVRRARARPGLVGRTGGTASRPLPRHKRAMLAAGLTGGSHHPSPALRARAPTPSCAATQMSAHTPRAHRRG
jgi:hypothetical protein